MSFYHIASRQSMIAQRSLASKLKGGKAPEIIPFVAAAAKMRERGYPNLVKAREALKRKKLALLKAKDDHDDGV